MQDTTYCYKHDDVLDVIVTMLQEPLLSNLQKLREAPTLYSVRNGKRVLKMAPDTRDLLIVLSIPSKEEASTFQSSLIQKYKVCSL